MQRPVVQVTAASCLAWRYSETERRIERIFRQAAADGATLWIDEIDSLCGQRPPGGAGTSSGNGYIVRTLTNEFLRQLDSASGVVVIAACNDPLAVDDAVRRRFTFVIGFRAELPPECERLAWTSLVGMRPPRGWVPIGASVSDVANAVARCRMLGIANAQAVADAIVSARNSRLGLDFPGLSRRGSLH